MPKLNISVILSAVYKLSAPVKRAIGTSNKLQKTIQSSQRSLKQYQNIHGDITHFQNLKIQLGKTQEILNTTKQHAAGLAKQIQVTTKPTQKLTSAFKKSRREVTHLKQRHQQEQVTLQRMRDKLRSSGISTHNLSEATRRLNAQAAQYNRTIAAQSEQLARITPASSAGHKPRNNSTPRWHAVHA